MDGWKLVPVDVLKNLLHCGDTDTFITPYVTARIREILNEDTAPPAGEVEVDRLKAGPPHFCGMPMPLNPHADAGVPGRYLEVGAVRECIPCLVKSRHDWANKANAMQSELTKALELLNEATIVLRAECIYALPREIDDFLAHQSAPACTHEWDINDQGTATTCSSCGARSSDVDAPAACAWTYYEDEFSWHTGCGQAWSFTEDGPKENGVKFCHSCGKPLEVAPAAKCERCESSTVEQCDEKGCGYLGAGNGAPADQNYEWEDTFGPDYTGEDAPAAKGGCDE